MRIVPILVAVLLAGCLSTAPATRDLSLAEQQTALLEPPAWQVGDWWTYEFHAEPFGHTSTGTVVVADVQDDHYLVGMPTESFDDLLFVFHFPPMGEVKRADLQWIAHDQWLKTLDFPLTDDSTWEVDLVGYKGTASVEVTGPTTASITVEPFLAPLRAEYDAAVGHYTRIGIDGYGYATLLDHGHGYTGNVSVPVDQKTVFYARAAGIVAIDGSPAHLPTTDPTQPDTGVNPGPVDVVELPEREVFSLVQWVGSFFLVPAATPGTFVERAEAPDGSVHELMRTPADGEGTTMQTLRIEDPGGTWTFTHSALGGGIAASEGILYDLRSFELGGA